MGSVQSDLNQKLLCCKPQVDDENLKHFKLSEEGEYRKELYQEFSKARQAYNLRRTKAGQSKLPKRLDKIKALDMETCHPKAPDFTQAFKIYSYSKILKSFTSKYFNIDSFSIYLYSSENSEAPQKTVPIDSPKVEFVLDQKQRPKDEKGEYCLRLIVKQKKNLEFYLFSNDLNLLKAFYALMFSFSTATIIQNLPKVLENISTIFTITLFSSYWNKIISVCSMYRERHEKSFLALTKLYQISVHEFKKHFKSMRLIKDYMKPKQKERLLELVRTMKRFTGFRSLKSTFKYGKLNQRERFVLFTNSQMIRKVQVLAEMIRMRRNNRSFKTQNDLDELISIDYRASSLQIDQEFEEADFRINFMPQYLQIENLDKIQSKVIQLSDISVLTTDLIFDYDRRSDMEDQFEYTINIFGPFLNQKVKLKSQKNVMAELCYLTPAKYIHNNWFQVSIHGIFLPREFVQKYNNQLLLKIKVTQYYKKIDSKQKMSVYSEEIPLNVSNLEDEMIFIQTDWLKFNLQKILDDPEDNDEKINFSVMYLPLNVPVHAVLNDYFFQDDLCWNQLDTDQLYENIKNKEIKLGEIKLKYSITLKNQNDQGSLDFQEGPRLLVGRFCLYNPPKGTPVVCQVLAVNRDLSVKLRLVNTHQIIGKNININHIKTIERYGVSIYDQNDLPDEFSKVKFAWKCSIKTSNKRLLNQIYSAIQNQHVLESQKRKGKHHKSTFLAQGNILCSLLDIADLKNCQVVKNATNKKKTYILEPRVEISIQNTQGMNIFQCKTDPIKENVQIQKEIKIQDLGNVASFIKPNQEPSQRLGLIIDLGIFQKSYTTEYHQLFENESLKVRIKVVNSDEIELGSCTLESKDILHLKNQAQENSYMLQLKGEKAGVITIQTRWLPDHNTRLMFHLCQSTYYLKQPEAYIHWQQIFHLDLMDRFHYSVPLGVYNWIEHTKNDDGGDGYMNILHQRRRIRPFQLQGVFELENTVGSLKFKIKNGQELTHDRDIFITQEELRDVILWGKNNHRPMRQDFTHNLINKWWAFKTSVTNNKSQMIGRLQWSKFLNNLPQIPLDISKNEVENLNQDSVVQTVLIRMKSRLGSPLQAKEPNSKIKLFNHDIGKLVYASDWNEKEPLLYSDLHTGITEVGIPDELRSQLWRECFNSHILEFDGINHFKKILGEYNPKKTLFYNLKDYADQIDCLGFQQIDEDVGQYQFVEGYWSDKSFSERNKQILMERMAMRDILRVFVIWQREKKIDNQQISISYGNGILSVVQRLLTVTNFCSEGVFWILVPLICSFPRLFSVSDSIPVGDCFSVMRLEIMTFKSLLENFLPTVFKKLKRLGIPIELIIYEHIMSLYANSFSTDIVLRLWDVIFYHFGVTSCKDKQLRKVGLWYILSPAFLVLKKKREQIEAATTSEYIMKIFKGGSTLYYDPNEFILDLQTLINELFVEGDQVDSKIEKQKNLKAFQMEEQRNEYQQKTNQIFKDIKNQNKLIANWLQKVNQIDSKMICDSIISSFKEIGQNEIEEASKLKKQKSLRSIAQNHQWLAGNLHLNTCHLFLHQIRLFGLETFYIKLKYIRMDEKLQQKTVKDIDLIKDGQITEGPFTDNKIESYASFNYVSGVNFIKMKIYSDLQLKNQYEALICLEEIQQDRFTLKRLPFRTPMVQLNPENYDQTLNKLSVSFFLERKHTEQSSDELQLKQSFLKKQPDLEDIFNKVDQNNLKIQFESFVNNEYSDLSQFLPQHKVQNIIDETYSYKKQENDELLEKDFIKIANQILPNQMMNFEGANQHLSEIFKAFTERTKVNKQQSFFGQEYETIEIQSIPFCLRSFLTSIILLSRCTVDEKIILLYDLFDLADGFQDDIRPRRAFQIIKEIQRRNQYFVPDSELLSIVEYVFHGQVSEVYKAYWTKDLSKIFVDQHTASWQIPLIQLTGSVNFDKEGTSIDVTEQVQHSILNYNSVFGTRVIDFNADRSPFRKLSDLIGPIASTLLSYTQGGDYQLVLLCSEKGQRFKFDIQYDKQGFLKQSGMKYSNINKDYINQFQRNGSRLFLSMKERPISKKEFVEQVERIPLFCELIRGETFYQNHITKQLSLLVPFETKLIVIALSEKTAQTFELPDTKTNNYQIAQQLYESNIVQELQDLLISRGLFFDDGMTWFILNQSKKWTEISEFYRLSQLKPFIFKSTITLKLAKQRQKNQIKYDCLGYWKHADQSSEWRACRIVYCDEIKNIKAEFTALSYTYWIEFEHCKNDGKNMWFKRNASEVLFSKEYTRYNQKNFERDSLFYLDKLYNPTHKFEKVVKTKTVKENKDFELI